MNEKGGYPFPTDIKDKQDVTEGAFAIVKEFSHHPEWIVGGEMASLKKCRSCRVLSRWETESYF